MSGIAWTLAVELQFYLLLPLLAIPFRGRHWPWATAAFVAASLLYLAWAAHDPADYAGTRFRSFQFPAFLGHFGLGMACARLLDSGWKPPLQADALTAAALAIFVIAPAAALHYTTDFTAPGSWTYYVLVRPAAAVAFAAAIFLSLNPGSWIGRWLSTRPLQWLGESSYSLYLVHAPVGGWLFLHWPQAARAGQVPFMALVVLASVLATGLFYLAVERPSLRLKDRVARRLGGPDA